MMSADFWMSVAIAVPLAVLGNMVTKPVQTALEQWLRRVPVRRLEGLTKRIARAERAVERPNELQADLSTLWTAYVSTFFFAVFVIVLAAIAIDRSVREIDTFGIVLPARSILIGAFALFGVANIVVHNLIMNANWVLRDMDRLTELKAQRDLISTVRND